MRKPIPLAVLKPLSTTPFKTDEFSLNQFATAMGWHLEGDAKSGQTAYYVIGDDANSDMLTLAELKAIIKADAIDPVFYNANNSYGVNQHWLHSLMQFYAECQRAWDEHEARTKALIGTPAGRIWRAKEHQR